MATSTQIANIFIERALNAGRHLTQMQLQKLVYISHGWNLAIHNSPLTDDSPEAWDYGPVYRQLWEALRRYGSSPVSRPIQVGDIGSFADNATENITVTLNESEQELVTSVYNNYSKFHAYQLSAMTHEDDTPWHTTYVQNHNIRGIIDNNLIRDHFKQIANPR